MHTLVTILLLVLFAAPAAAQTSPEQLQELISEVEAASAQPGPSADLDAAARALRKALAALEGDRRSEGARIAKPHRRHHNWHREQCIDVALEVYKRTYDEQSALRLAVDKCGADLDARLIDIAFEANSKVYDDRTAFERAIEFARRENLWGKGDLVRLAYDVYRKQYDVLGALDLAARWAVPRSRGDEGCIRRAYPVHRKQYDGTSALRLAAETCSR